MVLFVTVLGWESLALGHTEDGHDGGVKLCLFSIVVMGQVLQGRPLPKDALFI